MKTGTPATNEFTPSNIHTSPTKDEPRVPATKTTGGAIVTSLDDFRRNQNKITSFHETPTDEDYSEQSSDNLTATPHTISEIKLSNGVPTEEELFNHGFEQASLDPSALIILRHHFAPLLLDDLKKIGEQAQQSGSSVYANSLIRRMRLMRDKMRGDPSLHLVLALHDAMVYENSWISYSQEQYRIACSLIERIFSSKHLSAKVAQKAVIALEDAGFQTLPIELDFETED